MVGYGAPKEYICMGKRRAVVVLVSSAMSERFQPNFRDLPYEQRDAYWRVRKAALTAAHALPEHPDGDPDEIVRGILADAEGAVAS